jgi:hypothetical protein
MKQTQITATGAKGFLKWLQASNPAIYQQVAAELPQKMPQLFTQFEQAGGLSGLAKRTRGKMNRLGQTGFTGWGTGATAGGTGLNFQTNFTTGLTSEISFPSQTITTGATGPGSTGTAQAATAGAVQAAGSAVDVADAANPGPLSSPDAISLGQVVSDVASATQSVADAQATSAIANAQIARAQSGLAPLPIGIPLSSTTLTSGTFLGMSGSTLLWVGGGAALLLLLMGSKSRG